MQLPQLITNSRLASRKKCPRLHYFRYELGVRPDVDASYLRFGSVFHKGIEVRSGGEGPEHSIAVACQQYESLPAWCNTDEKVHAWMVERETVATLLSGYFWRWAGAANIIAEIVASELPIEIPIKNPETGRTTPNFRFAGKIDGIVRLNDGRLAIHEIKTTGDDIEPGSDYWKRLRIDHQISGYMHAARVLGFAVETVLYDVTKKPTIRPCQIPLLDEQGVKIVLDANGQRVMTKDGKKWRESGDSSQGYTLQTRTETPQEYGARLLADITARPDHYYQRVEIPRLDADLSEFEQELWDQQQDLRQSQINGRHYRNTNSCVGFGKCEFFDVCTNSIEVTRDNPPSGFVAVADMHPELKA